MWELIQQNRRRSLWLFLLMGACLILLGYFLGKAYYPNGGGWGGLMIALVIWLLLSMISYFAGDSIMLSVSGAREVTPDIHPQLFNVVEEMRIAASLPAMPKVYIIDDPSPNAFATGRRPENSAVAVTAGLLTRLNRDELQGVVAHETSHILNRDILFMTFAGVMLGSIVLISEIFLRGMWFSAGSSNRYRGRSRESGQGQAIIMIAAIVFAILAPILARLLYLAISRKREYLADASGVRLTRYPEGLASALEKISKSPDRMARVNKATAPMYIANPFDKMGEKLSTWTSTHPPIQERIKILRALSQGASLVNYQEAYSKIKGDSAQVVPSKELKDSTPIAIRTAGAPETAEAPGKSKRRDLGDLIRAVNGFIFLTCVCGLKIKIPPDFKQSSVACPRCHRTNVVPTAQLAAIAAVAAAVSTPTSPTGDGAVVYTRKGTGWESFACSCGKTISLSPDFAGSEITCGNCGHKTLIK